MARSKRLNKNPFMDMGKMGMKDKKMMEMEDMGNFKKKMGKRKMKH